MVSIEDYSITGRISKSLYDHVLKTTEPPVTNQEETEDKLREKVPIRRVKKWLMHEIQSRLMKCGLSKEESRIADIAFAYDNREMLKLL